MFEFLRFQVRDVMSEPVCIGPEATLAEVEELLEKRGFNGVPVVEGEGALVGWVTSLDVLRAFRAPDDAMLAAYGVIMRRPVREIMVRRPRSVTPRAALTRVLEKMVDSGSKSFPVLDDERLVGVVSREDVMQALRRADAGEVPPGDDA